MTIAPRALRCLLSLLIASTFCASAFAADPQVDFGRQIRPLLADKCFKCHGLNRDEDETEYQMDTKDGLFAKLDDGPAIVPGQPEESLLYQRLVSSDEDERMPPADYNKKMKPAEVELIKQWIKQGAPWQQHWSLVNPERPELPKVEDTKWSKNDIDRFVLARIEAAKLKPAPEADKETIIRRVTLDLTGLPPTLPEIDAFLADKSPQAYEKLVDRLLKSPHYAEHMARYWLDAARYADTHGLHLDSIRQIWPYRDWVINAFDKNMPFDQFTIEQLAGDLLPNSTIDQKIATGFNRCNVSTSEGGIIDAEFDVQYTVDRVSTMSAVWMGVTMGCVTCHEHKFDPFEMKDFYQLYAFFDNLDGKVRDGNKPLHAPIITAPNPANREKVAELSGVIESMKKDQQSARAAALNGFEPWATAQRAKTGDKALPSAGLIGHWMFDETEGDTVVSSVGTVSPGKLAGAKRVAGKLGKAVDTTGNTYVDLGDFANFERTDAFSYGAWVKLRPGNKGGGVITRMDDGAAHRGYDLYVSNNRVYAHIISAWEGNAIRIDTKNQLKVNEWQHVLITYDGSSKASGVTVYINGKASPVNVTHDTLSDTIKSSVSLKVGRRTPGAPFNGLVDEVRIYDRLLSAAEASSLAGGGGIAELLAIAPAKRSAQQTQTLQDHYLATNPSDFKKIADELKKTEAEKSKLEKDGQIATLIWKERAKPRQTHILLRGAYDKPGPPVSPNTPAALPPLTGLKDGERPTRLHLAKWLVSDDNPATSRVTVNRFWQQYFGAGIVKTTDDLGSQGTPPTHPQLLDWLAVEFREGGWDIKEMQKLIVMSATYRQSSNTDAAKTKADPENQLLSRGPRFRVDAEVVRDNALASSGLLVRAIGGASVKPYQPAGIWKAVGYTDSNTANFKRDSGEKLYRRTLYTFWKRTAPPPTMVALDAPSRETCTVRRSRTNTPLAALALMNDEQFVEAARQVASRAMTEGGKTDKEHAIYAFRLATSRHPSDAEVAVLLDVYKTSLERFTKDNKAANELVQVGESKPDAALKVEQLAAWTVVANMILNLDETVTKG